MQEILQGSDRERPVTIGGELGAPSLPLYEYETLPSTSDGARARLEAGERPPFALLARGQTAGRGRRGHSFFSPAGRGLYVTLALPVPAEESIPLLTILAGTAALEAVEARTGRRLMVKWVNDLFYNRKKAGGILAERRPEGILIGLGLNLQAGDFPPELAAIATDLDTDIDPAVLAEDFIRRCLAYVDVLPEQPFLSLYRERSLAIGRTVTFRMNGETLEGRGLAIDEAGGLVVALPDGQCRTLNSGEISIRLEQD